MALELNLVPGPDRVNTQITPWRSILTTSKVERFLKFLKGKIILKWRVSSDFFKLKQSFIVCFVQIVRFFMHYAIFSELCDRMGFEADYAKSHHRVISEAL